MGILARPISCNIFPEYDDQKATARPEDLITEEASYDAAVDDEAIQELDAMVKKKWIKKFASKFQAKRHARGRIVLSKLLVIAKERKTSDGKCGVVKKINRRLLLNLKRSGVTDAAVKTERPELPRVLDIIFRTSRC